MNLMEARKEKLKSELLSLQYGLSDPKTIILPIPEKMDEEDFVRELQSYKYMNEYEREALHEELNKCHEAYRYGKISE